MFEESKAWFFIFIVAVLGALGYGAHYLTSVDEANAGLIESKAKLGDINEVLTQRKKAWEDLEKVHVKLREMLGQREVLSKAKEVLGKRYRTVDSDLKYAVESAKASVERNRNNAAGTELGDITLSNGRVLRGAKVRKVDETGISLIHSDGIGVIPEELLPMELKEKYDLGADALVPQLESAQIAFLAKPEKEITSSPAPATGRTTYARPQTQTVTTESSPQADPAKEKAIKLRMAELDARIETYENSAKQYRDSSKKNQELASSAKSNGQPSTRHTQNANDDLSKATQMERQVAAMREERKKLQVELEYAMRPR